MPGESPRSLHPPDRLAALLFIGPIVLFLAATGHGILEVHSSTDTWIGLAAGRQILTGDEFPKTDTFSYTFNGKVWYNQNWLTHLAQYWLYSTVSPNAVIFGTWALSASVFALALLAAYWRSGSWLGALLAASVVGLGCRDFLSARPATTGYFCIASLWALLCALEGQRDRRRWWPIALLLPLLLVWGNAHGSFVFGYGVLGLYVGYWFVVRTIHVKHAWAFSLALVLLVALVAGLRYAHVPADPDAAPGTPASGGAFDPGKLTLVIVALFAYAGVWFVIRQFRPRIVIGDRQVIAIVAVVIVALILTVALGPFGIENFTHGGKVAGSEVFRRVSEWNPPFARDVTTGKLTLTPDTSRRNFPPMLRFWLIFGFSVLTLLSTGFIALFLRLRDSRPATDQPKPHVTLFDAAMVIIGIAMTFWARRFAPIYFIFGAPVALTWIILLLRPIPREWRPQLRLGLMIAAGVLGIFVARDTWKKGYRELVADFGPRSPFNLLERVTRYDGTPHNLILFLRMNELHVNVLTEWTQAGPVMFQAPNAKVFMDGRAQQVYDEAHYMEYSRLMTNDRTPRPYIIETLDKYNTTAVMIRNTLKAQNMLATVTQSPLWVPALMGRGSGLYLRRGSPGLRELGERLRNGEEWRPDNPWALASRGFVWQATAPPDPAQALACWKAAVEQQPWLGLTCFRPVTRTLLELDRLREAKEFVDYHFRRLNQQSTRIREEAREELLKVLRECWAEIEAAEQAGPDSKAED